MIKPHKRFKMKKICAVKKKHYLCNAKRPDGGIGRRDGLKHR